MNNERVTVYDDMISPEIHKELYEWTQTVPYYAGFAMSDDEIPKFDFIPGKDNHKMPAFVRRALYRHPVASSQEEFDARDDVDVIKRLWDSINEQVFDGQAEWTKGIPEGHPGMYGPKYMYTHEDGSFCDQHNFSLKRAKEGWKVYLNARAAILSAGQMPEVNRQDTDGAIHKDTSNDRDTTRYERTGYYTVLFVTNLHWKPSWRGDLVYFGEEETGEYHWKRGWNLGFANMIVGNKPGRLVIQESEATHTSLTPSTNAEEMALRMAFRVKSPVKPIKNEFCISN